MSLVRKIKAMRHIKALLLGTGLIIATNAIVLAGVAYNRSGEPDSTLTLTERELSLPYYYSGNAENSGIELQLMQRSGISGYLSSDYQSPKSLDWFDKEKLAELGFDVSAPINEDEVTRSYQSLKEKEVILVLEYNGAAYQSVLEAAQKHYDKVLAEQSPTQDNGQKNSEKKNSEKKNNKNKNYKLTQAEDNLTREKTFASRLFVVDAGQDRYVLRAMYPDRAKYFLMKGLVMAQIKNNGSGGQKLVGYIKSLSNPLIHVPLQYHEVLEAVMADKTHRNQNEPPRYEATINIGRRLEPWLGGVKGLGEG
jgi:hypothetical protein